MSEELELFAAVDTTGVDSRSLTLSLGAMEAGKTVEVSIDLLNLTGRRVDYDSVAISCNCTNVSPARGMIADGRSHQISINFTPDSRPTRLNRSVSFTLQNQGRAVKKIRLKYTNADFFGFPGAFIDRQFSADKIPNSLLVSLETSVARLPDDFRAELVEGGDDDVTKIKLISDPPSIVIPVAETIGNRQQYSGRARLRDGNGAVVLEIPVSFSILRDLRIFPPILKFFPDPEDSRQLVASCVLLSNKDLGRKQLTVQCRGNQIAAVNSVLNGNGRRFAGKIKLIHRGDDSKDSSMDKPNRKHSLVPLQIHTDLSTPLPIKGMFK